ncbi:MAG: hypothetical protein OEZ58_09090 [Gammaproteobacteria bacterium]|nr:hypothetical protein [Gammaproteobacteria bacterium]
MPIIETGQACLENLANHASEKNNLNIVLKSQKNVAYYWKYGPIHPLQSTQNIHQTLVHQGKRAKKTVAEKDILSRFCQFNASEAENFVTDNIGVDDTQDPIAKKLSDCKKRLRKAEKKIKAFAKINANDIIDVNLKVELKSVYDDLSQLLNKFGQTSVENIKDLKEINGHLAKINSALNANTDYKTWKDLCSDNLSEALSQLEEVTDGIACVQMFYTIEPFYLFRLLVAYQVLSKHEVTDKEAGDASKELTGLLNNYKIVYKGNEKYQILFDWLREKICDFSSEINKLDANHVKFHLKGGRALEYLLGNGEEGENDWDTSILINPSLPAKEWYELFNKVNNLVLEKLNEYKLQFYIHMHQDHCLDFLTKKVHNAPSDLEYKRNCKAELIDIGIPRRDTAEAWEQWTHTAPHIINKDHEPPIPGHMYYVDEYVLMIREVLANVSTSVSKVKKRLSRMLKVLQLDSDVFDIKIKTKKDKIEIILNDTLPAHDSFSKPEQRLYVSMVSQFIHAFELQTEAGLRQHFYSKLKKDIEGIANLDVRPDLENGLTVDEKKLLKLLTLFASLSDSLQDHLKARQTYLGLTEMDTLNKDYRRIKAELKKLKDLASEKNINAEELRTKLEAIQRKEIEKGVKEQHLNLAGRLRSFVKALYTASLFSESEEMEVVYAVTGSFAAYLYADYARLPEEMTSLLDPVSKLCITLFTMNKVDPKQVYELFLKTALENYLCGPDNIFINQSVDDIDGENPIYLPLPEAKIGEYQYRPMAVEIRIEQYRSTNNHPVPQLSFIWGYPVVAINELIREYEKQSALAEEFGVVQQKKQTTQILKELATRFG